MKQQIKQLKNDNYELTTNKNKQEDYYKNIDTKLQEYSKTI